MKWLRRFWQSYPPDRVRGKAECVGTDQGGAGRRRQFAKDLTEAVKAYADGERGFHPLKGLLLGQLVQVRSLAEPMSRTSPQGREADEGETGRDADRAWPTG